MKSIKKTLIIGMAGLALLGGIGCGEPFKGDRMVEQIYTKEGVITRVYDDYDGDGKLDNYHETDEVNEIRTNYNVKIGVFSRVYLTKEAEKIAKEDWGKFIKPEIEKEIEKRYNERFKISRNIYK